jgi:hypothetical protein
MPNQVEPGTMGGAPAESGTATTAAQPAQAAQAAAPTGHHTSFHGRPVSWVAVVIIVAGFLMGGLSIVFSAWPTFWVGAGIAVVGAIVATAADVFDDWY